MADDGRIIGAQNITENKQMRFEPISMHVEITSRYTY